MMTNPALWQEKAQVLAVWAQARLTEHPPAMDYLRESCGLSDAVILDAGLGYIPDTLYRKKATWGLEEDGKDLWLPRGIVFPCHFDGRLWYVKIWRDDEGKHRFVNVSGSTIAGALYGGRVQAHTVLVEGEDTALFIQSQLPGVGAVSLGGSCNNIPVGTALEVLWGVPYLTIHFNNHEAGKEWAERLKAQYLPNAKVLLPSWPHRTIVDAWRDGVPVVEWLRGRLFRENAI